MSTNNTLLETVALLNTQPIPTAERNWGGADVIIRDLPPKPPQAGSFRSEPRYVVTPRSKELSWLFERLRDAFYEEKRVNSCSKIEFFGRLANTANRCIQQGHGMSAVVLCRAVLHEAFTIYDEMEAGEFRALGIAVDGEIVDDMADDSARTGYISKDDTIQYFKKRGLEVADE